MSAPGLLLRVVLMLSLLLNGLNVAMAGPMALALAEPTTASSAAPPCHGDAPATGGHDHHAMATGTTGVQAPHDGDHCKIKDCLRSCAQQPSLTVQVAWLATPPPVSLVPLPAGHPTLPTPPLDRITRPPIA